MTIRTDGPKPWEVDHRKVDIPVLRDAAEAILRGYRGLGRFMEDHPE
jgi:hypothetical protein